MRTLDATAVGMATDPAGRGYWEVGANGAVVNFEAPSYGTLHGAPLNAPVVALAPTRAGSGYWQVASDGGIFSFGNAAFHGSMGGHPLDAPIVGMATDPATGGYWEVASDGGVFAFDAPFFGSMGGHPLNAPVVDIVATGDGGGYWEVASDGGVFSFGDATFHGSMGGQPLDAPIVGMANDPATGGYWEVASDGGMFSFNAAYFGSMGGHPLDAPVTGMAAAPGGTGYLEVSGDGGIFSFGGAQYLGSAIPVGHAYLPPSNPPANVAPNPEYTFGASGTSGDSLPPCWQSSGASSVTATPSSPSCIDAELDATDSARALEGLSPVQLPSNFVSLTPQEQLLVITDIERVSRGEAPVVGLASVLDGYAQQGAANNSDPTYSFSAVPSSIWYGANWAGGVINALDASYTWVYNDGWAGPGSTFNIDCTGPTAPGCWGHRDNILSSGNGGTLVMGAGYVPESAGVASLSELFVSVSSTAALPPLYYTWADALAAGAGA